MAPPPGKGAKKGAPVGPSAEELVRRHARCAAASALHARSALARASHLLRARARLGARSCALTSSSPCPAQAVEIEVQKALAEKRSAEAAASSAAAEATNAAAAAAAAGREGELQRASRELAAAQAQVFSLEARNPFP